jgi:hypothetical protein
MDSSLRFLYASKRWIQFILCQRKENRGSNAYKHVRSISTKARCYYEKVPLLWKDSFPGERKTSQKHLYKYSQIFPQAKCFGDADKEFFLRDSYQINNRFFDTYTYRFETKKSVFDYILENKEKNKQDYYNFIENGHILRNIQNGEGFGWTVFDEGKDFSFLTFYQDNYKFQPKDQVAEIEKIKKYLKACKEQFEFFKNKLFYVDEIKGKELNYRLIFRTLRTAPTNIEQFKTDNLIFLGKEEVSDRIEGIFDLRYEYFKRRFFEPVYTS